MMAFEIYQVQAVALLFIFAVSYPIGKKYIHHADTEFWNDKPIVGLRNEWLAWSRATLRSVVRTRDWVFEGYSKYSKSNSFFLLPAIDRGKLLVVPPQQMKKLYGLPEKIMDISKTANTTIQADWTIWDPDVSENLFQTNLIRNQLTKNLDILTPPIALELEKGFEREWGTSKTEWKRVDIWISALNIIAGAANSAFCGAPLCRDSEFLSRLQAHSVFVFLGSLLISSTPKPIRFITGYFIGWSCYFLLNRVIKICLPFVEERLHNNAMLKADPAYSWVPPKDGLQWMIEECYAMNDHSQLNPRRIIHRLVFMNDISMHSTAYTTQNLILDLASADPSLGYIEALREESARVLREAGGKWTRQAVAKLHLVDSTIRESMRMTPFNSVGLPRTVIDPHGISVQQGDSTLQVPRGTVLAIPVEAIHYDSSIYPDAMSFQPFRFAQPDAAQNIVDAFDSTPSGEGEKPKPKSSATVDEAFLGFGFGKHSCPGRFFALNEVKILVANMVLHYDIEPLKTRPKMTPIIWLNVPLFNNGTVRVRRREPVELL